jgi:Na+/proline symporter
LSFAGISLLSYPAEIYNFGTAFCWSTIGVILALICTGVFIIPVIYPIQSVSIYHYLQDRFDSRILRVYGAVLFTMSTLLYISIVLYAPSVALAGERLFFSILVTGAIR